MYESLLAPDLLVDSLHAATAYLYIAEIKKNLKNKLKIKSNKRVKRCCVIEILTVEPTLSWRSIKQDAGLNSDRGAGIFHPQHRIRCVFIAPIGPHC